MSKVSLRESIDHVLYLAKEAMAKRDYINVESAGQHDKDIAALVRVTKFRQGMTDV